jgi:hypothetical protein
MKNPCANAFKPKNNRSLALMFIFWQKLLRNNFKYEPAFQVLYGILHVNTVQTSIGLTLILD